jgi:hypothetical protein
MGTPVLACSYLSQDFVVRDFGGMVMKIIYGLDTGSIEDASQCVLIDAPDIEDLEEWLEEFGHNGLPVLDLVGFLEDKCK